MNRLLHRALVLAAGLLAALGVFVLGFGNVPPPTPADGVTVEGLLRAQAFGALRPGDVHRLQQLVQPSDRFVVVGPSVTDRYGNHLLNAQLLLGSMLMPAVMVDSCRGATVVIALQRGPICGSTPRVAAVLPSGVTLYRV